MDLINPSIGLIFWTTLTFVILLFLLKVLAWRPIIGALRSREDSINDALNAAERAKADMQKLQSKNEKLLEEARVERDNIIKEARAAANALKEEAKEEASKISSKMVEDARNAIHTEKQAALADVKNQVATLSLEIAEKLIKTQLKNDKAQKSLVEEFVKELNLN